MGRDGESLSEVGWGEVTKQQRAMTDQGHSRAPRACPARRDPELHCSLMSGFHPSNSCQQTWTRGQLPAAAGVDTASQCTGQGCGGRARG